MRQSRSIKTIALVLTANLITLGFVPSASAGVISTEAALEMHERSARIERISSVLARDNVQNQMVRLGVDPQDAAKRLAALSDSELQQLEARMDELPAGANGALEVIGIVMLVLLILELVGITDVFKSI
ncbi:MAG: PA2779 family protein [Woeseia sp.]